jgi:hypothetical protein
VTLSFNYHDYFSRSDIIWLVTDKIKGVDLSLTPKNNQSSRHFA